VALLATVAALALAACGGDDESSDDGGTTGAATTERTEPLLTETEATETAARPADTTGDEADEGGAKAPSKVPSEDQEGGAGDEIPASSQALVTGDGGKLSPATVRVPPFIAIRLQLRSADGVEYELTGGGKTVKAGGEIETAGTSFPGLRSGEKLVLKGPAGNVTIVANAEPGP
jgi:hypothetical protein